MDAHAVRIDEVEGEFARPGEHVVVLAEIGLHVLHGDRAREIGAESALELVELMRAEIGDHAAAIAFVEAPARRIVDAGDVRIPLPVPRRPLPEIPSLLREILRQRRTRRGMAVPFPVVVPGNTDGRALDRARIAVQHKLLGKTEGRVAAPLVAHLERDARLLRDAHHRLPLLDAERHRLLAEHMLPGPHGGDGDDGMPVVRRADAHGVDGRIGDHLAPVEHLTAVRVSVTLIDQGLDDARTAHVAARRTVLRHETFRPEVAAAGAIEVFGSLPHHVAGDRHAATRIVEEPRHISALGNHSASDDADVHQVVRPGTAERFVPASKGTAAAEERNGKRA